MATDSLGDRMKGYENKFRIKIGLKQPVIIRIDGKAFHTYTRPFARPYSEPLKSIFDAVCKYLLQNVQGCKMIYHQSDEISLVLSDLDSPMTSAWFDNNLQKLASISASMTTAVFNKIAWENYKDLSNTSALFDARAFAIPEGDLPNYIIWRQQDWIRNSVSMLARSIFSHKMLHGKNTADVKEMLKESSTPWENIDPVWKYGTLRYIVKDEMGDISETICAYDKFDYETLSDIFRNTHTTRGSADESCLQKYSTRIVEASNGLYTFKVFNLQHGGYSRGPEKLITVNIKDASCRDVLLSMRKEPWATADVQVVIANLLNKVG